MINLEICQDFFSVLSLDQQISFIVEMALANLLHFAFKQTVFQNKSIFLNIFTCLIGLVGNYFQTLSVLNFLEQFIILVVP